MKYPPLLVGVIMFLSIAEESKAQFNETIRTGRPGQAIGPFTVGTGVFQNQSGIDFSGQNTSGSDAFNFYDINSVFRYGLNEYFEVSSVLTYSIRSSMGDLKGQNNLSQADFGGRTHIYTGKGAIPSVGFQYRVAIPFRDGDFKSGNDDIESKIMLITGQSFGAKFGLNLNFGVNWISDNPIGSYVASLSYSINDTWGAVAEVYGTKILSTSDYTYSFDGGISYLVNNNFQLDLFGGYGGFNNFIESYFISTGVSWRIVGK